MRLIYNNVYWSDLKKIPRIIKSRNDEIMYYVREGIYIEYNSENSIKYKGYYKFYNKVKKHSSITNKRTKIKYYL